MTTTTGQTGTADVERLRVWARGAYDREAGVELLIRSGLLERTGAAAARPTSGGLDTNTLDGALDDGRLSAGERRTAVVVLSLLGGAGHEVDLSTVLPGLVLLLIGPVLAIAGMAPLLVEA